MNQDTICAISTAKGKGAIATIRISGLDAINISNNIFKSYSQKKISNIKSRQVLVGKIFKDNKLKSIIVSEEYKFWKFISGRKFLNEQTIKFDTRLLKNFYLNKGFYDVEINSSFAKLISFSIKLLSSAYSFSIASN